MQKSPVMHWDKQWGTQTTPCQLLVVQAKDFWLIFPCRIRAKADGSMTNSNSRHSSAAPFIGHVSIILIIALSPLTCESSNAELPMAVTPKERVWGMQSETTLKCWYSCWFFFLRRTHILLQQLSYPLGIQVFFISLLSRTRWDFCRGGFGEKSRKKRCDSCWRKAYGSTGPGAVTPFAVPYIDRCCLLLLQSHEAASSISLL